MSDTSSGVLYASAIAFAIGMAVTPIARVALRLILLRFARGPAPMTYRDADGVEHTDMVDPESVESIGKFLSRVRSHTSESADVP